MPVVLADGLEGTVGVTIVELSDLPGRGVPQLIDRPPPLVRGQVESEALGVLLDLLDGEAPAGDVDEGPRAVHDERAQLQTEVPAVGQGELVHPGDAHRPGLGVQAGTEAPQRVYPTSDPVLRLQDDQLVAPASQLVSGHEPGQAGADDDHPLRPVNPP